MSEPPPRKIEITWPPDWVEWEVHGTDFYGNPVSEKIKMPPGTHPLNFSRENTNDSIQ